MGFRDFNRVRDELDKDRHLSVTNANVDTEMSRFTYEVAVTGIPSEDASEYILDMWDPDWFPTDYIALQRIDESTIQLYIGDGYSFPVPECDVVLHPHEAAIGDRTQGAPEDARVTHQ